MSSKIDKLNKLIDDQQAILDSVKAEARSISADDVYRENEELKSKIDILAKSESNLKAENGIAEGQLVSAGDHRLFFNLFPFDKDSGF